MSKHAVFLDRDGTIIRDTGYPSTIDDLILLPGAAKAIETLNELGLKVVVVSNQSGVGLGFFDEATVDHFHAELRSQLKGLGARIDAFYYCPHPPGTNGETVCGCRKPGAGLINQAANELDIQLGLSFVVGDKISDIIAGSSAGCRTILLDMNHSPETASGPRPDHIAPDLLAAAEWILSQFDDPQTDKAGPR